LRYKREDRPEDISDQKEITEEQELIFACPFCETELLLKLDPFKKKKMDVLKSAYRGAEEQPEDWEYDFPEVIPAPPR
jgi:predicted RNA-binding Zn-ribbon protein involved in translation (DUF1610 family)